MAGMTFDAKTGIARVQFRYGGKQFQKSLKTTDEREAEATKGRIEDTLRAIENGWLVMPPDADIWYFLRSQGKIGSKPELPQVMNLGELFAWYFEQLPENAKEPKTVKTEQVHKRHFLRRFGANKPLSAVTGSDLQEYVNQRSKSWWHGKPIGRQTIVKELATLQMVWERAYQQGKVRAALPNMDGLQYPKGKEKPPFQTWEEIEQTIARGGLNKTDEKELWDCLFLNLAQIAEVLEFVRTKKSRNTYLYPTLAFAAHSGARLSEIMRSKVDDFKFEEKKVVIREKKKDRTRETLRRVTMSNYLYQTMKNYFNTTHPGGVYTICRKADEPMKESTMHEAIEWFFLGSKWEVLRGYHVFRHSFASNLARAGEDERVIDELMGHMTEAMRRRYRHFFPEQRENAINRLFG